MLSEPRMISIANGSRCLVCLVVFIVIAFGYFGSASTVETAETLVLSIRAERIVAPRAPIAPSGAVPFDFDGGGKTDIGRWHGASTEHKVYLSGSSSYQTTTIGSSTSKPVSGEFDGDGRYDVGTYLNGTWTVKLSKDSSTITSSPGTTGDIPVMGNFDGNGTSDCSVFRPSTSTWWILVDCTGSYSSVSYGSSGDIPVTGDYDGDNKTDIAVFRPTTGYWYASLSGGGSLSIQWGISTDAPMSADFDGDGSDDLVAYRPSSGTWYVLFSDGGFTNYSSNVWGNWYDQPVPGDYDGDGITDRAIWRPTTSEWWIAKSSGGTLTYTLGVPGDTAIPSSFIKQVGGTATGYELATSRLDPENATGGTDLYSRNFSWGTSLVSLPGRSGLDAGLGLSYNSLVWIKTGGSMYFNPDAGNVAPGFRLGLPTIEPIYYNDTRSKWAYMMVTPSGKRVEFVETSVDEVFETADSSYTQLITGTTSAPNVPSEGITMTVKTTDGTQMIYSWNTGAYRCTRIKDRNGNYIDIAYSAYGKIETITDTLGRVINVNYDGYGRVSTITQTWKGTNGSGSNTTHTYATLTYTTKTVATNWSPAFYGPPNDTAVTVLDKVTYSDGSATKFEYNGYIQVKKVTNVAADTTTELNYVETDLDRNLTSTAQSDVPRFGETRSKVKDFNGNTAVVVKNTIAASEPYTLGSATGTATRIQVWSDDHPDDLRSNTFVYATGWNEGLPIGTEDCITTSAACTTQKRWTWNQWTQDNEGVSYILNPRITESKVGDGTNTKRTTIEYYEPSSGVFPYGLQEKVKAYGTDGTTILKTQVMEYNLSSNYTNRRIIGLPSESRLYEGSDSSGTLMSKVTFAYDENGYTDSSQNVSSPTKHDTSNYGTGFNYRGNQTSITRWDITDDDNSGLVSASSVVYDILGNPILQKDPRNRETDIIYTDNFNDTGTARGTYAYPTTIRDANDNVSTIKYRFDLGANVWARSPTPSGSGNTYGKTTSRELSDTTGRLTKQTVETTGAYTRYVYASSGNAVTSYSTIIDVNGDNFINTSDEVATESVFDGAGRLLKTRSANPNSTGGYTAKKVEYDILGRAYRETVPTEIDGSWEPDGDDDRGSGVWLWNTREFDWKGRVTRTIPSDSNGSDGKDTLIGYAGCGCAGGMITTIQGPVTTAKDVGGTLQTTKRRVQKVYADILGRTAKTEVWDLDGAGSTPYSTVVNTYNGRDQLTNVREYSGGTSSGTYQDTTMSYDGHGRPYQIHKPEWFDGSTLKYSTTTYNADDTPATVTDPRGTVTAYSFGNTSIAEKRAVLLGIAYSVPGGSGIPDPSDVSFEYDPAGNRTNMSDGLGTVEYSYDELSRLKTESRNFTDTLTDEPSGGLYTLTYNYHLTGGLKSIKDPWNNEVTYASDSVGRTTSIGANSFDGRTNGSMAFASGLSYRAFGGIKAMTYATEDTTAISLEFDNALRPTSYTSTSAANNDDIQDRNYTYYNDGMTQNVDNAVDGKFSQAYEYDFASRVTKNKFGESGTTVPYEQNINYDTFNHITSRQTWDKDGTQRSFTAGYTNNRRSSGGYQSGTNSYDFSGNTTQNNLGYNNKIDWKFDAVGRMTEWLETRPYASVARDEGATVTFDGDGRSVKKLKRSRDRNITSNWTEETEYSIFSTVLGTVITTADTTGKKTKTNVYMGKSLVAEQTIYQSTATIIFKNYDPVTNSLMETDSDGVKGTVTETGGQVELEVLGAWINTIDEEVVTPSGNYKNYGRIEQPEFGCTVDGHARSCSEVFEMLSKGTAVQCPNNNCGPRVAHNGIGDSKLTFPYFSDGRNGQFQIPSQAGISQSSGQMALHLSPSDENTFDEGCDLALKFADKSLEMLNRAKNAIPRIQELTGGDFGSAALLAAIGVVESGFENKKQDEGGPGRGVYQIEPKTYGENGVSEELAMNFDQATVAVFGVVFRNYKDIITATTAEYGEAVAEDNRYMMLAGAVRTHNKWRSGVVEATPKGVQTLGRRMKNAISTGSLTSLDEGTSGGRGKYVTKVMSVWYYCFPNEKANL